MNNFVRWMKKEHSLSKRLLVSMTAGLLVVVLLPYAYIVFGIHLDHALNLPSFFYGLVNTILGCLVMLVGLYYGIWSISEQLFKANGSPVPLMGTHKLLVSGPFSQCRNPMAFGTFVAYFGLAILLGSLGTLVLGLLFDLLLILYIKKIEEKELELRFGQEYVEYKSRTPLLIPQPTKKKDNA